MSPCAPFRMFRSWPALTYGDVGEDVQRAVILGDCRFLPRGLPTMTTTTTAAGVTTSEGGSSGPATIASSPPSLLLPLLPPNGHRVMPPLRVRTPTGDEDRRTPMVSSEHQQPNRAPLIMDVAIRCTFLSCSCDCFSPCKSQIRTCDGCGHGWVSHALDKLGFRHIFNCHQVELVQPSIAFDVASLMLYGTQAIPVRLKILLDRLFSVLRREEVLQVLHGFGWTHDDYSRGYILQDPSGRVLDRWLLATREEEPLILQQFLRFGETKTIAHQLLLQDSNERSDFVAQSPRTESDIKKFIERANKSSVVKTNTRAVNVSSALPLINRSLHRQPSSSLSSTRSLSPTTGSPVNNISSPTSLSPLNRLQNMQPYDYRREKTSPKAKTSEMLTVNSVSYSSPSSSPGASTLAVSTSSVMSMNPVSSVSRFHTTSSDLSGNDAMGRSDDDDDDDDSSNAINLTRTGSTATSYLDSIFAARKVRHLRKSANPMKRRWNPMVLSALSTNPSTGKKRVQCHVCLKTFCDKGALKIHFSAVHLREMHKCSVEGCNMMFSSRRSRNRHSANPNPKLHTPNYRRKVNPHDGRSANPYPLIPATSVSFNNSLLGRNVGNSFDGDSNAPSEIDPGHPHDMSDFSLSQNELRQHLKARKSSLLLPEHTNDSAPFPLTKKRRTEDGRSREDDEQMQNSESVKGMDLSMKENRSSSSKGVHKRKSLNPIKCQMNSDDDLLYVSTDDSSSDTYIEHELDENGQLDSKSDYLSSDSIDSKNEDDVDITRDAKDSKVKNSSSVISSLSASPKLSPTLGFNHHTPIIQKSSSSPLTPIEKQNGFASTESDGLKKDILRNEVSESDDISENPLRHLETLSLGSFANMIGATRNPLNQNTHGSSGVSYHAPCLGLGPSIVTTTAASRAESPPRPPSNQIHHHNHSGSLVSPPSSQPQQLNSDTESSLPDQQISLMPVYRDASIVGSVEIPVDKENPRRCTACGKIFQNHFGVKTHYQNVHLKLMHKCTVEGCNAAFPSKRSRDRHSANLNLHRKLLSTTSEKSPSFFDKGSLYPYHTEAALRGDFFSRLYDTQSLPLSFADLYHSRLSGDGGFLGGSQYPRHLIPGFHPAFMLPPTTTSHHHSIRPSGNDGRGSGRDSPVSSVSSTNLSPQSQCSPLREPSVNLEEDLKPDSEGRFTCNICEKKFHESVVLREHYENCHSRDLLRCKDDGCNKVFLSGKSLTIHANELHKDKAIEAS